MTKAALEAAIKDEIDPDDFDMESKRRSAKINYDYKSWALIIIEALKTLRIALNARGNYSHTVVQRLIIFH